MPFKSKAQRRWMYANKPEMAQEFEDKTPEDADLPEKSKKKEAWDNALKQNEDKKMSLFPSKKNPIEEKRSMWRTVISMPKEAESLKKKEKRQQQKADEAYGKDEKPENPNLEIEEKPQVSKEAHEKRAFYCCMGDRYKVLEGENKGKVGRATKYVSTRREEEYIDEDGASVRKSKEDASVTLKFDDGGESSYNNPDSQLKRHYESDDSAPCDDKG